MSEDEQESMEQTATGKLAWFILFLALGTQVLAYVFFLEQGIKFSGINFSEDEYVFGWFFQGLAFIMSALTMFLALRLDD